MLMVYTDSLQREADMKRVVLLALPSFGYSNVLVIVGNMDLNNSSQQVPVIVKS